MAMDLCFNRGDRDHAGWELIKRFARLGGLVLDMPPDTVLEREGWGDECWNVHSIDGRWETPLAGSPDQALQYAKEKTT